MAKIRRVGLITAMLVLAAALPSVRPGWCDDGLGYTDTPRLPGSPWRVHDRQRPQPTSVEPGSKPGDPPADALVLFDGGDLSQWEGGDVKGVEDGCINILKTGQLSTKQKFGDCQLHIEWATPAKADGVAVNWGNSGVWFLGKYELQILESRENRIYADGIAGAIYGQTSPVVNVARKPGEWQTYDVVFHAPRFEGDKLAAPASFTVFWNGVLVQDHTASLGPTRHREVATYESRETVGPLMLQQHGSAVRFRNIWIRPLKPLWPFFAFQDGLNGLPFDAQAKLLKQSGYDGIEFEGTAKQIPEMLGALDAQGLKMFAIYTWSNIAPDKPRYNPDMKQAIERLKGRDALISLTMWGDFPATDANDEKAVAIIREIAEMAEQANLRVALYPHVGMYVARVGDGLRLAKKVNRKNVGVGFNLCHFLKIEDEKNLERRLAEAMPYLFTVSINGADGGDTNALDWPRLIQTLDRGSFDIGRMLRTLKRLGFDGPVGLQGYGIPGKPSDNLQRSIKAWRTLCCQIGE